MRRSPASLKIVRNRAWNGRPENAAPAERRGGVEGAASGWKRDRKGGGLRLRGNRKADAANWMKPVGLDIMRIFNFRIQC
ncbi:MAG: hypothetical protein LBQ12_03300 [Deltaproteobacteria bacterium]|jgi:hypothetical protein|nr:hypothetical protein [Deltaproteobacteria bacterium]